MDAITDNSFIEASEEIHLSFFSLLHPSPYKAQIESLEGRVSAGGGGNGRFCAGQYVMNCSAIQRRGYNNSNILLFGAKTPAIRR